MTGLTVSKRIEIEQPQEVTFKLFTEQMAAWWPTDTHSIADEVVDVVVEGRAGGEIYEVSPDGERGYWGTILEWDPPHRVVVSWRPSPEGSPHTTWEARFAPVDAMTTRLELDHFGWEAFGDRAAEMHGNYDTGWDAVLGHFVAAASDGAGD